MSDVPRRTLSELEFIYSQDRDRRDVYVEGSFDAAVLHWFTHECALNGVAVYPISAIEISDGDIIAAGRKANNRERVVHLADFLADSDARRAACVVDADFWSLRAAQAPAPPLYQTDYSCMEMYFFSAQSLGKFFTLCCRRSEWPVETIMESLASVLQEFFLYRCANDDLGWGMDWLDKNVCMKVTGWQIDFDKDEYLTRFLHKNSRAREKTRFVEHVTQLRTRLKADARYQMDGHDMMSLLAWYIRKKGIGRERCQDENVLMCLTMTLDHRIFQKEHMFQMLSARLGKDAE
jgi:hypothetical protein